MTLSDLASIATVISSIAVLGSLIYLALQTQQDTRHTRALIQQGRNAQRIALNMVVVTDPSANELMLRGDAGDPTLAPEQVYRYLAFTLAHLYELEDNFYQHNDGLLNEDRHAGIAAWLQYVRAIRPGFRAAWELCRGLVGSEFRAFADAKIREGAALAVPSPMVRWPVLAAREREKQGGSWGAPR